MWIPCYLTVFSNSDLLFFVASYILLIWLLYFLNDLSVFCLPFHVIFWIHVIVKFEIKIFKLPIVLLLYFKICVSNYIKNAISMVYILFVHAEPVQYSNAWSHLHFPCIQIKLSRHSEEALQVMFMFFPVIIDMCVSLVWSRKNKHI